MPPSEPTSKLVQFGVFELDLLGGELRKQGVRVKLQDQPLKVLQLLLEKPGQVVNRDELRSRIWPADTYVEFDQGLYSAIARLRDTLGDSSESPRFIGTVARRGYRFIAPVTIGSTLFETRSPEEAHRIPRGPDRLEFRRVITSVLAGLIGGALLLAIVFAFNIAKAREWLRVRATTPTNTSRLPLGNSTGSPNYTQITNFTDSAVAPALSPDGNMVAFYRSDNWFLTPDQIYLMMLPHGEPVQLTNDHRLKYGLAFSPDGSRIAYTTYSPEATNEWKTYTVSPLGGEPALLLSNAAGLSWLDQRVLFSEKDTGAHMGVVTATENRSEYRKLYFPQHQRMMAHFSYPSPDHQWAIIVEMNPTWQPCRLISLLSSPETRPVGPQGQCTSAAWSPDGEWMYFAAEVDGTHHLWRQRFPDGKPEQFTFGATEEAGLAMAPDGRSLITSIGLHESALWIHDKKGDRALSSEGYVELVSPEFSNDGKLLYYLMRHDLSSPSSELWRNHLDTGKSEAALPGFSMLEYDVSGNGKEVVFATQPHGQRSQLWLAQLDGGSSPRMITSTGERTPRFGPDGHIIFQFTEGNANYLGQIRTDGSERSKLVADPISILRCVSPDGGWVIADVPLPSDEFTMAIPTNGGSSRRICTWCSVGWSPDGKVFYVGLAPSSHTTRNTTLAIPLTAGQTLPKLPSPGIQGPEDAKAFPGTHLLNGWDLSPGNDLSTYAYVKTTMHRNLYRIPVP